MSNLTNNTTSLQEILDAVNNLPDAGGSESEFSTFTIVNNTPYYLVYGALIIEPASSLTVPMSDQQHNLLLGVMWIDGYKEEVEAVNVLLSEMYDWNEMGTITNIEETEYIVPVWNINHDGGAFRTNAILDLTVMPDYNYVPNSTITITKPVEPIQFIIYVKATRPIGNNLYCTADEGMTWAQWIESDYDSFGVYITGSTVYALYQDIPVIVVNPDGTRVTPNDVIVAGWTYKTSVK